MIIRRFRTMLSRLRDQADVRFDRGRAAPVGGAGLLGGAVLSPGLTRMGTAKSRRRSFPGRKWSSLNLTATETAPSQRMKFPKALVQRAKVLVPAQDELLQAADGPRRNNMPEERQSHFGQMNRFR